MVMALDGIKVLDLSRLAPGPHCSMLLADFGADVTLVEAVPGASAKLGSTGLRRSEAAERAAAYNALGRGKKSIALNLKEEEARKIFYRMVEGADVVIEGFRPGVVKRLGVDYDTLAQINPRIICCSISGFGQTGPYANLVGHDINYIAIGGALGVTGRPGQPPAIPVNLLADFAGGGLTAAFAICLAIIAREKTGRGQNIDVGMSDGVLSLMTSAFSQYFSTGQPIRPGEYLLNGAAPFYNTYKCSDGRWFSIGSIEPHFWANLCRVLGTEDLLPHQFDQARWPEMIERFAGIFATKTADEWMAIMSQDDICAAPVLEMENVVTNEHNLARGMVVELDSPVGKVKQIGVAPKLSDTPGQPRTTAPLIGQHTDEILGGLGYTADQIADLRSRGVVG
ncbi:CaiB/BaiF CoA-transferase family protein [Tepidiforma sp.]|jgi:crotonobetainyl-CoA:carnitine CoA-transferase CaiB-like acyl-CoA transferase|uniref:CaiB/BaiF CoA transferase family protein n=1 Tax=Tepidiforma sp. TaxID=2682230 RepID=UPI0021DC6545|nr:CaiB/BaiF CoA-transferase family protein [Tepidiforma sp.]MCX7618231.1 CoA transferase [Tepidiforma sp.]GIW17000.1 MAG: CoA transferase [Tepidiforma sp.]